MSARLAEYAQASASRRTFLKLSVGAGAGLIIGAHLPTGGHANAARAVTQLRFTPFVQIAPDDTVTVIVKHLDMGQANTTGLATLVAEELDARADQMDVAFAPADAKTYKNLFFGIQGTGGSTAIANSFEQYRKAGATAKAMLIAAAADMWSVPVGEITVSQGRVRHAATGQDSTFGALAERASTLPVPEDVVLKAPDDWVYIGKRFPRLDAAKKSSGALGMFGMDVQLEGMLVAVLAQPPKFGATLKTFDAEKAKSVEGVVDVFAIPQGVVVVAEKTWPAIQARKLLKIDWDTSAAETRSTDQILADFTKLVDQPGLVAHSEGDADAGLAGAAKIVEATYTFPYLAHAPMEPLDVTVLFDGTSATFWTGSQLQTTDQMTASGRLGIPPEKVAINTLWAGGSFGRRAIYNSHYIAEAAEIAKAYGKPVPIKLVYTREDDIKGGYYRPLFVHKVRAGLDEHGNIVGWHHRIAGQSIMIGTLFEKALVKEGVDKTSVEGVRGMTYAARNVRIEVHNADAGVPVLWWRSVGHTHTAYVMETIIDELAENAGRDPVAFRLELLKDDPRKAGVLRLAAEKAGWETPPPKGRYRGVAVHQSFKTYVAEVAEVSLRKDGSVKVEKVVCAVDCGIAVNPDNIKAQMEGGIGFGLGAVLRNEITMSDGAVDQANFNTYKPLRMSDMPEVEVHIVDSSEAPTGAGEPGTPPIGPAVANAIAAATGKRVRDLPFTKTGMA
ncbi:MAG: xanthine dehydrogenase family protein molybdopterin-binding subunit [Hyphomicrobiales bacterium]|nr:xanthine dehydrogenase family protein molybdopterin-binding subunit [Hyphomicrobiales bacterium]